MVNNSDGTCPASLGQRGDGTCVGQNVDDARDVITTNGGFGVWGALAVDGNGCMKIGSNGLQVPFDANVFDVGRSPTARSAWSRTPGASCDPQDALKPPSRLADRSIVLKRNRKNNDSVVGLELDPSHIAAAEVSVNGSHRRHARRRRRAAARASCATARSPTRRRSPRRCKALFAEHELPKRVRLGIANQRIVVRSLDLPPLEDPKALAAAVARRGARPHPDADGRGGPRLPVPLGVVRHADRPAHARGHRRRPPRDDRPPRRRRQATPA